MYSFRGEDFIYASTASVETISYITTFLGRISYIHSFCRGKSSYIYSFRREELQLPWGGVHIYSFRGEEFIYLQYTADMPPTKYLRMQSTEQCLASSKILIPHPLSTQRVCPPPAPKAGETLHTHRAVRGWGVNILEDARHWIGLLLYNLSTPFLLCVFLLSADTHRLYDVPYSSACSLCEAVYSTDKCAFCNFKWEHLSPNIYMYCIHVINRLTITCSYFNMTANLLTFFSFIT